MRYLLIAAALMLATPAAAQTVKPQLAAPLPNAPGKTMTVVTVTYAPGQKSGPHYHAGSAFLYARVLSGQVRSEVEGQGPTRVYGAGEAWTEGPNAHHTVSENASATEPASITGRIRARHMTKNPQAATASMFAVSTPRPWICMTVSWPKRPSLGPSGG